MISRLQSLLHLGVPQSSARRCPKPLKRQTFGRCRRFVPEIPRQETWLRKSSKKSTSLQFQWATLESHHHHHHHHHHPHHRRRRRHPPKTTGITTTSCDFSTHASMHARMHTYILTHILTLVTLHYITSHHNTLYIIYIYIRWHGMA